MYFVKELYYDMMYLQVTLVASEGLATRGLKLPVIIELYIIVLFELDYYVITVELCQPLR